MRCPDCLGKLEKWGSEWLCRKCGAVWKAKEGQPLERVVTTLTDKSVSF